MTPPTRRPASDLVRRQRRDRDRGRRLAWRAPSGCRPRQVCYSLCAGCCSSCYLELLPVAWRQINAYGIRIGYRTYDCPYWEHGGCSTPGSPPGGDCGKCTAIAGRFTVIPAVPFAYGTSEPREQWRALIRNMGVGITGPVTAEIAT